MSYPDVLELSGSVSKRWSRLPAGSTGGRPEAWLRDTLQAHADILPVSEIDPAYGGLQSVCTELKTDVGSIDNVFVNSLGRLTLVECKLWRNPESRRKVVAQILDYAKEVSRWSYSELQARVNARTGKTGNYLYEIARAGDPNLQEHLFVDATTKALREGRFMLLIAGDGIREDVESIGTLLNRNAAASFAFGMVEIALYQAAEGAVLLQPRLLAKSRIIERTVFKIAGEISVFETELASGSSEDIGEIQPGDDVASPAARIHAEARGWWNEIVNAPLQDPEQGPLKYYWPHNVRASLPWPGTWITAYRSSSNRTIGVFLGGRTEPLGELLRALARCPTDFIGGLPSGTLYVPQRELGVSADMSDFASDDEQRSWLFKMMNLFVNELRPLTLRLMSE